MNLKVAAMVGDIDASLAKEYFDLVEVIIMVLGKDAKVRMVNRKGAQILACSKKEIVGKNWFDTFIPVDVRDEMRDVFFKLMAGELAPIEYYENPVLTCDGRRRVIA